MKIIILHNQPAENSAADEMDVLVQRDSVAAALVELGHQVSSFGCNLNLEAIKQHLYSAQPDLIFNLVESLGGSDRLMPIVPMLLETLKIPYTGTRSAAIIATSDKTAAKRQLAAAGLPTPAWWSSGRLHGAPEEFPRRWIVKPNLEHASKGIDDHSVIDAQDLATLDEACQQRSASTGCPHFAEEYIPGRELNLSLIASADHGVQVLPPAEIDFSAFPAEKPRIVGYSAKWDTESFEYQQTPRRFMFSPADANLIEQLSQLARDSWKLFGLTGYARVDFRVDERQRPWILEINANPCLSPDAGFAAALAEAGLSYIEGIRRVVEAALTSGELG